MDVAIICEPYRNYGRAENAGIWTCGRQAVQEIMTFSGAGFVRGNVNDVNSHSFFSTLKAEEANAQQKWRNPEKEIILVALERNRHPNGTALEKVR